MWKFFKVVVSRLKVRIGVGDQFVTHELPKVAHQSYYTHVTAQRQVTFSLESLHVLIFMVERELSMTKDI